MTPSTIALGPVAAASIAVLVALVRRERTRPDGPGEPMLAVAVVVCGSVASLVLWFAMNRHRPEPPPVASPASTCADVENELGHNRWREAQAQARGCSDPATLARLRFVQGDFVPASAMFARARKRDPASAVSLTEIEAHLFANELALASRSAQRMAGERSPGAPRPDSPIWCIAGRIERLTGQPAHADTYEPCVAVRSTVTSGMQSPFAPYDRAVANPFSAFVGTRGRLRGRPLAIERVLLGKAPLHAPATAAWAAELALFHAWSGTGPADFLTLDVAATDLEGGVFGGDDAEYVRWAISVGAAAALYAHDDARVDRYTRIGDAHSAGVILQVRRTLDPRQPWEPQIEDDHWVDHARVFTVARARDGAPLAALLLEQHTTGADTLARVFPRLQRNQNEVRAWFDNEFPAPCLDCGASELLGHLVERRNVARVLGRTVEVDTLDPVIARFVEARLAEKNAYVVDELEAFFTRS